MAVTRSRWIVWCTCLLTIGVICSDAEAQPANARTRSCDNFMEDYARSSARKLTRALSGQGYGLETLELNETFAAKLPDGEATFEVFFEKKNRAAGVADETRAHRRTYTIVGTDQGPVVTSHLWPPQKEIARGAECRPDSSRIEAPKVAVRAVDVEPFKFWGLRVTWHLPEQLPDDLRSDPLDALLGVLGSSTESAGEPANTSKESPSPQEKSDESSGNSSKEKSDAARAESESE